MATPPAAAMFYEFYMIDSQNSYPSAIQIQLSFLLLEEDPPLFLNY